VRWSELVGDQSVSLVSGGLMLRQGDSSGHQNKGTSAFEAVSRKRLVKIQQTEKI
jgi:hypothetical protein